jgi:hypothetical protein
MATGLAGKLWNMANLVAMIDAPAKPPKRPRVHHVRRQVEAVSFLGNAN